MDTTTKAIALLSTDYNENDKLVLLYSLEYGKITVHARGVRKSTAKLKFCVDRFCFGQYELAQNGDRFTLKTCTELESFYALREDILSFYGASVVAELLANYTDEGENNPETFVTALKALRSYVTGENALLVTLKFLLCFLQQQGYLLCFDACTVCGNKIAGKHFVDGTNGEIVCNNCHSAQSFAVPEKVVGVCNLTNSVGFEKLHNLSFTGEMLCDTLSVLLRYLQCVEMPCKSLSELIKLA